MKNKCLQKINLKILSAFLAVGILTACSMASFITDNQNMDKYINSKNFKDGKFLNHHKWEQPGITEYAGTMFDFLFGGENRTPKNPLPREICDLMEFNSTDSNHLSSTWLGHSTLLINIDGIKIITDPVFEKSATLIFGPRRFNGEIPVDINNIKNVDLVLISHNHYDHLNEFSIKMLDSRTKLFVVPLAVGKQLETWGISISKIIELDWWNIHKVNSDLKIISTPAQHFSGRGIFDRDETLWSSFVIESSNHKLFYSGDSGYFDGFSEIGDKYGPFDTAFLECGAYNEKWHHIHMYPEETIRAGLDLRTKIIHPIHWGTFNLSIHAWYEPMERAWKEADKKDIKLALPVVGETVNYNLKIPDSKWWESEMKMEFLKEK